MSPYATFAATMVNNHRFGRLQASRFASHTKPVVDAP
jgi:hypothetical protein